jgi:hypothetical protein
MAEGPARIDSPEVIREFRAHFVKFDQAARNALLGLDSDVKGTFAWLRGEQLAYWKAQLRKREELLTRAQGELANAQIAASYSGKNSFVDEKRAVEKAKRMKEEAEQKIQLVRKWSVMAEQEVGKRMGPCNGLAILLDHLTPMALARLDQMVISLEGYLRDTPADGS